VTKLIQNAFYHRLYSFWLNALLHLYYIASAGVSSSETDGCRLTSSPASIACSYLVASSSASHY